MAGAALLISEKFNSYRSEFPQKLMDEVIDAYPTIHI